ncbi:MAG: SGNH/GDSL hydrolase family protein [Nitrososphaeraceae archaeon]|nr:SGNH/GDSL hydrolase family protein [Nitrososphaeraceae archaeon]
MKKLILSVFLCVGTIGIMNKSLSQDKISYLALGDSYTIGEAVAASHNWPNLLRDELFGKGIKLEDPQIIATTGWTTDELLGAIDSSDLKNNKFDLVSLLIGVNNQYRGYPIKQYQDEFEKLLKKAISFANGDPSKVFVVSIPDYGVTTFAKENNKDADKIKKELHTYDKIAKEISDQYNVPFYNIYPISLKALWNHKKYIASDGLHPSGAMYQEWVSYFAPGVYSQLVSE